MIVLFSDAVAVTVSRSLTVQAAAAVNLTLSDAIVRVLLVFLLIAINAFFVTAEFSIVSVRRSRISQLVAVGDIQAKTVQNLQRSIDRLLSTTQLGITLSSLALGWIGESTMAVLIARAMTQLPISSNAKQFLTHSVSIPIAFLLIAYLQIVLGELCPKSVALLYSEQLARFLGPPSLAIARFFNPFIWILNQSTRQLLRLCGVQYRGAWYSRLTPEELQLIIATSSESTGLEAEERELLKNVFEFGEVLAGEIMIPRTNIAALPVHASFHTLLSEIANTGHSRYPVMGESLDDIQGIIHFKQLAEPLANGELTLETPIRAWLRPARFIPEQKPLNELLPLMQRSQQEMVIVVDEFGGTAGLLTIQDIIAEIIGSTEEPTNTEDLSVQMLDDQTYLVQAQLHLEEVNELLNLELPILDEYQTLGGFLIYNLQKIPNVGETLNYNSLELTVISAEGPRLHQIRVRRTEFPSELNAALEIESPSLSDSNPPPET
ncbi:hemolysin family protein [Oscillatoria laete-virens NRMC-F 0139]|nr:hemolysin family protein [Oscillatoria laete-virens]MDL5052012.1 hemolysin family protein [Oscillatoria laete-virens NRMC-F 0139]